MATVVAVVTTNVAVGGRGASREVAEWQHLHGAEESLVVKIKRSTVFYLISTSFSFLFFPLIFMTTIVSISTKVTADTSDRATSISWRVRMSCLYVVERRYN